MAATSGKRRSFNTDLDHLRKCFNEVDRGKSGFIGLQELTKLLDRDKDGKVSKQIVSSAPNQIKLCQAPCKYTS